MTSCLFDHHFLVSIFFMMIYFWILNLILCQMSFVYNGGIFRFLVIIIYRHGNLNLLLLLMMMMMICHRFDIQWFNRFKNTIIMKTFCFDTFCCCCCKFICLQAIFFSFFLMINNMMVDDDDDYRHISTWHMTTFICSSWSLSMSTKNIFDGDNFLSTIDRY